MALLPLAACTTVHGVRPLGAGAVAVEAEVGGPLAEVYGAPIPVPLSSVGVTVGVSDQTDVHAALHPSPLLFFGVVGGEAGVSTQFLAPRGAAPRLMGDLTVLAFGGDTSPEGPEGGVRTFVQPTLTTSWDWGREGAQTVYLAGALFTQPWPRVELLPAFSAGNRWAAGRFLGTTEVTWIAPFTSSADLVPTYYAPGRLGGFAVRLGAGWRFGKEPS